MSQREFQRYQVISKTIEVAMSTGEAAQALGLSQRQVFRQKAKVTASGPQGLIHGNRGRSSATTKPEELMQKVRHLYDEVYRGFTVTHFTEKLTEHERVEVSRETVRKELRRHHLIGKMRLAPKHRSRRERVSIVGMMLQHDTSEHDWLEGRGPVIKLIDRVHQHPLCHRS